MLFEKLGAFFALALLPACLGADILVTPKADVLSQGKGLLKSSPDMAASDNEKGRTITDKSTHPFRQLTVGSTPAGWMQLGTPPKWLKVIFDTGSDKLVAKTWETISQELDQMDQGIEGMIMPSTELYSHNASSSYHHLIGKDPLTGKEGPLMSMIAYGSGDAVTEEGVENIVVGTRELKNFSLSEIVQDQLQLLHTAKGISGILGLQHMKNKSLGQSIFSKMREAKQMSSFGYCRGANNTGTFIWGDDSTEGDKIPVIGQMHWAVTLQDVRVQVGKDAKSNSLIAQRRERHPHWQRTAVRTGRHRREKVSPHSHVHQQVIHGRDGEWQKIVWPFGGAGGADGADGAGGGSPGDGGFGDDADSSNPFNIGGDGDGGDGDGGDDADWGPLGGGHDQGDFGVDGDDAGDLKNQHDIEASAQHMCTEWNCTAILDTGSNILAGPTKALKGIIAQINVKNDCSNFDQLPPITLKLGGRPVTIHAESYVMKVELPPGMPGILGGDGDGDGMGGDGDGDGDGDGSSGAGGHGFDDQSGAGGDDDAGQGEDAGGMGGGSGGCGSGGGCAGGAGGEMGDYGMGSGERLGVRMPHAPAPAVPHTVHIGIPGVGGTPGISININRRDSEKHAPEDKVRSKFVGEPASLAEKVVKKTKHESSTTARWRSALADLKKHRGIDLSAALRDLLNYANGTEAQYMCMPALVPLDKQTPFGPLWIVGTPFLDEYYGRYSFDYDAESPSFSFVSLKDAKTCQNLQHNQSSPTDHSNTQLENKKDSTNLGSAASQHRIMRAEQSTPSVPQQTSHQHQAPPIKRGPIIRKFDDIIYPHWAKSLLRL